MRASQSFVPTFRLFQWTRGGFQQKGESTELIENRIARAVTYFREHYGCKVFNLSLVTSVDPIGEATSTGLQRP